MNLTQLQMIPIVYTTRLERMSFMDMPITGVNLSEVINCITAESKPKLTDHPFSRPVSRNSKTLFKYLVKIIGELNKKVRNNQYISKRTDVLLKFCEPFTVVVEDTKCINLKKSSNEKLSLITDEVEKYLVCSRNTYPYVYFMTKNCNTHVAEVCCAGYKNMAEYYRVHDEHLFPEQHKCVIKIEYCCWHDREVRLKLFFQHVSTNMPSFITKPHECARDCACCCFPYPRSDPFAQHHDDFKEEQNYKVNCRSYRILDLIRQTPSNSVSNTTVINKALRFVPKISRTLATPLKGLGRSAQPIFIQVKDRGTEGFIYYTIGAYGLIDTYLKAYVPEEISHSRENAEPLEKLTPEYTPLRRETCHDQNKGDAKSEKYCCYGRRNMLKSLAQEYSNISENSINFLKEPHACPTGYCECCCKSPHNTQDKRVAVCIPERPRYTNVIDNVQNPTKSSTFLIKNQSAEINAQTKTSNIVQNSTCVHYSLTTDCNSKMGNITNSNLEELKHVVNLDSDEDMSEINRNSSEDPLLLKTNENECEPMNILKSNNVKNDETKSDIPSSSNVAVPFSLSNPNNPVSELADTTIYNDLLNVSQQSAAVSRNETDPRLSGFLVNKNVSKFQGIRLGFDDGENVKIENKGNWSKEHDEILQNLMKLAQKKTNKLQSSTATESQICLKEFDPEPSTAAQTPGSDNPNRLVMSTLIDQSIRIHNDQIQAKRKETTNTQSLNSINDTVAGFPIAVRTESISSNMSKPIKNILLLAKPKQITYIQNIMTKLKDHSKLIDIKKMYRCFTKMTFVNRTLALKPHLFSEYSFTSETKPTAKSLHTINLSKSITANKTPTATECKQGRKRSASSVTEEDSLGIHNKGSSAGKKMRKRSVEPLTDLGIEQQPTTRNNFASATNTEFLKQLFRQPFSPENINSNHIRPTHLEQIFESSKAPARFTIDIEDENSLL